MNFNYLNFQMTFNSLTMLTVKKMYPFYIAFACINNVSKSVQLQIKQEKLVSIDIRPQQHVCEYH